MAFITGPTYTRREALGRMAAGAAAATLAPSARADDDHGRLPGRRPNIILVLTDDQGFGDVSQHGHPFLETPNLDQMHGGSVRFADFHVSPYCVPTRAALLTGRNPATCGVTGCRWRLTPGLTTAADVLRSAGYATGIFGKWHLGYYEPHRPERHGFDEVLVYGGGALGSPWGDFPNNSYFGPVLYHNGVPEKTEGYCCDVFFDRAMDWMNGVRGDRPFFAYVAPNTPHEPFIAPEAFVAPYREPVKTYPEDPRFLGQDLDDEKMAHYFGMIANLDMNLGRLRRRLADWGVERDTLLVYMNDNGTIVGGGYWNAGMRGSKATVYSGGTRAISYWEWPGTLTPGNVDELCAHVDVMPTLAALAGAEIPRDAQPEVTGRSLVPLLEDASADWPKRMLFDHQGTWKQGDSGPHIHSACTVRWGRYHLVRNARVCEEDCPLCGTILWLVNGGDEDIMAAGWELYDLASDPGERRNIAGKRPEVTRKLAEAYHAWWESMGPYFADDEPPPGHTDPLPFPALYWRRYRGPGPNNAPPPEGFLSGAASS